MDLNLQNIVSQFEIQGNVSDVRPLGNGLINTTYKVETEGDAPNYVLQHVNNAIFPDDGQHRGRDQPHPHQIRGRWHGRS